MSTRKPQDPVSAPASRPRPLHTRKSAWKLGWPLIRFRVRDAERAQPAPG